MLWVWLLLWAGDKTGPLLIDTPSPVSPGPRKIVENSVYYEHPDWLITVHVVDQASFNAFLQSRGGVEPELLARESVQTLLNGLAVFVIQIENRGQDTLQFNPDQITLRSKHRFEGTLVEPANFWPQQPIGEEAQRKFARVFQRRSVILEAGQKTSKLVAFEPLHDTFRKEITLSLSRIYYGLESFDIVCGFAARYEEP